MVEGAAETAEHDCDGDDGCEDGSIVVCDDFQAHEAQGGDDFQLQEFRAEALLPSR